MECKSETDLGRERWDSVGDRERERKRERQEERVPKRPIRETQKSRTEIKRNEIVQFSGENGKSGNFYNLCLMRVKQNYIVILERKLSEHIVVDGVRFKTEFEAARARIKPR